MWLIVGLGNPGDKYELTRHNAGFLVVDALLDKYQPVSMKQGFSALAGRIEINGSSALIIKPQTFMNRSGLSVQQAMSFHKIALDKVIVIHDELDLPLGTMRIKKGGGNNGHNGLKDISRLVGDQFIRVRIGIGRPEFKGGEAQYVLGSFSDDEIKILEPVLLKSIGAIETLISNGFENAQQVSQINVQK
ncbi:MAG: aminoacyl-tRNA hydrolase [Myxococcales bacterium]|nr:aminoacyl-tRNA hydrolase [Myxococcales bacterium]USN51867.1 MAG: aminoacyl-tRNA hydrolase [Myxococcales bacterium]